MKTLLLTDYLKFELAEMPVPEVGPHDVLIRVAACGICGSDIHGYDGGSGRRIPPLVMGHEAAGVIAQVGESVQSLREGMPVTFDSMISCGQCHYCRRGESNLCDRRQVLGVSCGDYRRHGAFAQFVLVPEHIVYALPGSLSMAHAAMVEPVSVAVHAVNITPITLGDTALVVGCGMIGLLVVQTLKLAGCARIIVSDIDEGRMELARQLGASEGLNPEQCNVPAEVVERTGGRGADVAVEAVGATAPIVAAIQSLRKGGALTLVGNIAPQVELPLQSIVTREIRLQGSCASSGEYPRCIELLASGAIDVEPLISARAPLSEGPRWFSRLHAREPGLMKVILEP
jgi:L-iditol 2-dehydrogenase